MTNIQQQKSLGVRIAVTSLDGYWCELSSLTRYDEGWEWTFKEHSAVGKEEENIYRGEDGTGRIYEYNGEGWFQIVWGPVLKKSMTARQVMVKVFFYHYQNGKGGFNE